MRRPTAVASILALAALALAVLTVYTYRELPVRLFASDDYQWLLNVRGLSFGQVVRRAFDAGAQSHFYRPLVWLLFWLQARAFDLDPRGYHAVSLGLHLLNAGLLGALAYRLQIANCRSQIESSSRQSTIYSLQSAILAAAFVALHPAPFEAVVWISAQSELLAAALLLVALHCWLYRRTITDERQPMADSGSEDERSFSLWSAVGGQWSSLATVALGLALLAKESAVIGLPLLVILGQWGRGNRQWTRGDRESASFMQPLAYRLAPLTPYVLPGFITLAYIAVQVVVERRNYLLEQGGYGIGPQIVLNPLRSLALIVAPLAGTEHADAAWLVPVGALVAVVLLIVLARGPSGARWLVLALGLTLLPTAPFAAPPNSRYLYLPVMASALLLAAGLARFLGRRLEADLLNHQDTKTPSFSISHHLRASLPWLLLLLVLGAGFWTWFAAGELHEREWRFAAGAGPGGSLWRLADSVCHERQPDRMIVVEPPIAGPIVEAIVQLSCGSRVKPVIVGRDQIAGAIKGMSVVVSFPNGSATEERPT